MKRLLLILLITSLFFSCATIENVEVVEPAEVEETGLVFDIFNSSVSIDENQPYKLDEDGKLIEGITSADFIFENSKAKFIIPPGNNIIYDEKIESYVFALDENTADVITDNISYKVHGWVILNGTTFNGMVAADASFTHDGKQIIFLVNDNPTWSETVDFDYDFYSKKYRDKIEYDIILDRPITTLKDLGLQFAAHDGYGMQVYGGEPLLIPA